MLVMPQKFGSYTTIERSGDFFVAKIKKTLRGGEEREINLGMFSSSLSAEIALKHLDASLDYEYVCWAQEFEVIDYNSIGF